MNTKGCIDEKSFWTKLLIIIAQFTKTRNAIAWYLFTNVHLQWRHNGRDSAPNHQLHYCLLKRLFRRRSKKALKLRVTGLCAGNSPVTGKFPAQMASNAENVSIWWRHHEQGNPHQSIWSPSADGWHQCLLGFLRYKTLVAWPRTRVSLQPVWQAPGHHSDLKHDDGMALKWRHNEHDGVSNHQPHHRLLDRLFRRRSKLRVTGASWGEFTGDRWIPRTKGQ